MNHYESLGLVLENSKPCCEWLMIVEGLGMAKCDVCSSREEVFMDHYVNHP